MCTAGFADGSDETSGIEARGLCCPAGHRFDRARQGYITLLSGRSRAHRSDTADMVAARRRILGSGLFAPVADAVAEALPPEATVIVDAGAGTGDYLARALAARPAAVGIGIDLSRYCARALARCHRRAVGVVADLWEPLPVRDGVADAVLSIFAPRNAAETVRLLAPGGRWILVTPNPGHLAQVREALGMLDIGEDKLGRLHRELSAAGLTVHAARTVIAPIALDSAAAADLAGMGPAGFHRTPAELAAAARALAGDGMVRAQLDVTVTIAG